MVDFIGFLQILDHSFIFYLGFQMIFKNIDLDIISMISSLDFHSLGYLHSKIGNSWKLRMMMDLGKKLF